MVSMGKKIAITGAAGNLGSLLAQFLLAQELHLLEHVTPISEELRSRDNVQVFRGDLADSASLDPFLFGVDCLVHFAGVLFMNAPEKFLPITNTLYLKNLVQSGERQGVKRIILISFPHVEGESTSANPARGHLEGHPQSVHAQTRLEEEKYLFERGGLAGFEAVSLRVGMVYGQGILMIDTAHWLAKYGFLGSWDEPTEVHLISTEDFLEATKAACLKNGIQGIYHLGDEGVQTLQEFFVDLTQDWGVYSPMRMPLPLIYCAAFMCEKWSAMTGRRALLTRDFITIGRASYYGDTLRMRAELLPQLRYLRYQDKLNSASFSLGQ